MRAAVPYGHWKTTTFIAGLITTASLPPLSSMVQSTGTPSTYLEKVLVPELRPGDIVIMDNLSGHKGHGVVR